jgi:hypothetical protein
VFQRLSFSNKRDCKDNGSGKMATLEIIYNWILAFIGIIPSTMDYEANWFKPVFHSLDASLHLQSNPPLSCS